MEVVVVLLLVVVVVVVAIVVVLFVGMVLKVDNCTICWAISFVSVTICRTNNRCTMV